MLRKNAGPGSESIMPEHTDDGMIRFDRIVIEGVAP
jgi:hypothetical protein